MARHLFRLAVAVAAGLGPCCAALPVSAEAAMPTPAPSAFGCSRLADDPQTPVLEGRDGMFFRIYADIRMDHAFSDEAVELLGQLADVLRARGTTLVYLPIPTKSLALPDLLPDTAEVYGFRYETATAVYRDILDRLRARGVVAVDGQAAMRAGDPQPLPFFHADFHWTAEGARRTAAEIAREIAPLVAEAGLETSAYATEAIGPFTAFSGLRRQIQRKCVEPVPMPVTTLHRTRQIEPGAGLDLFGGGPSGGIAIAIAGTSFADSDYGNFDGWLSQYTGLEVANYAITGGNQFGAMLSYLTSADFDADRPQFLIWENPVYNNLMQYGADPLRELIAAAGESCTLPLPTRRTADGALTADLAGAGVRPGDILRLAAGQEGPRAARFALADAGGGQHRRQIHRNVRLRATGTFYLPVGPLAHRDLRTVTASFDTDLPPDATLTLCRKPEGGL